MSKYFLVLLLSLVFTTASYSGDYIRTWDQGPLTWEDFQGKNGVPGRTYLYYELTYETEKQDFRDTSVHRFVCKAYIEPEMSWVDPAMVSPYNLKYHQVIFNYLEIQRRQLQKDIDHCTTWGEANLILSRNRHFLEERLATFYKRTNAGSNIGMIDEYLGNSARELEKLYSDGIPNVAYSNFKYGFNFMMGTSAFTQDLGQQFATPVAYSMGLELYYKQAMLTFELLGSEGKATTANTTDSRWGKDESALMNLIGISLGYQLFESKRFVFYPFAGIAHSEIRDKQHKNGENDITEGNARAYLGFGLDYKFGPIMRFTPSFIFSDNCSQSQYSVKFKFYVTNLNIMRTWMACHIIL